MNYKESLFFVAKCLTINHEEHNKIIIENLLKSNTVDWDAVVKLSSDHYVFPALYCNLKRASFLSYVPAELVEYMKYFTDLNRNRNKKIIEQAKQLNELLLQNKITPIFLKGTGNLLEGLYQDIGERMVVDIDFIFSKQDFEKTYLLLIKNGYSKLNDLEIVRPDHRHLPRLIKDNKIAAIEIHKEILIEKYTQEFNYDFIKNSKQTINNVSVISFENQLILSVVAAQINDYGFDNKNLSLRNAYDVFLLSKKTIAKDVFSKFKKLKNPLNCFLANCFEVFNKPDTLQYTSTKQIEKYLTLFYLYLDDFELSSKNYKKNYKKAKRRRLNKLIFEKIYKLFFQKKERKQLFSSVKDKNWRELRLIQWGLKKPKSNF
jgi:hypothetical protein